MGGRSFVKRRYTTPAATRKKRLSPSANQSTNEMQSRIHRSTFDSADVAPAPSRIQTGIKLSILSYAEARARAAHSLLFGRLCRRRNKNIELGNVRTHPIRLRRIWREQWKNAGPFHAGLLEIALFFQRTGAM